MSADNYIAILSTPKADGTGQEYRVTVFQDSDTYAPTGFATRYDSGDRSQALLTEARILWEGATLFEDEEAALEYAVKYEETHVVEYGMRSFELPEPYPPCPGCNKTHPDAMGTCPNCHVCLYTHGKQVPDDTYPLVQCQKCEYVHFWD